ncbi:hypothetical protein [Streptomyces sp. YIM 98790]|uniref:hypothetical protein n=1 Tax=Streptomyces sp. YIM 98790 TaxID=2689077 RepID=UPI001A9F501C|nr:hypothetical protein [Streptomyces sp. YIM 98790]
MTTEDRNAEQSGGPDGTGSSGNTDRTDGTGSTDGTGRPDPAGGPASLSDEAWEEFQRSAGATARSAAAPREPSARARMVTTRLRAMDEQAVQQRPRRRLGRRAAKEPEPWQPPGWRTGPAWQDMPGGRRRRRPVQWLSAALLLVLVAYTAKVTLIDGRSVQSVAAPVQEWLDGALGETADRGGDPVQPVEALPPETAPPSEAPAAGPGSGGPSLERPYRGSPALVWADGADAIELPEAADAGGVPAKEIAEGLRLTKEFLVAANLEPEVLAGGVPEAALALIDPGQQKLIDDYRGALDGPTAEADATVLFSRFDPAEALLVDVPVKVRGHMEVVTGEGDGQAMIRADYTFVYPVTKADGSGKVTRTVVRRVLEVHVVRPGLRTRTPGHVWLSTFQSDIGNSSCESPDGLLHPEFSGDPVTGEAPPGPTLDPYDRSRSLEEEPAECGTVSRI